MLHQCYMMSSDCLFFSLFFPLGFIKDKVEDLQKRADDLPLINHLVKKLFKTAETENSSSLVTIKIYTRRVFEGDPFELL